MKPTAVVLSNFLYTTKAYETSFSSLDDMYKTIGPNQRRHARLLIDLKGKSTLGELYFNSLFDQKGSLSGAKQYLVPTNIDYDAADALKLILGFYDYGYYRDAALHSHAGACARLFAQKMGIAFVGYSEELH